MNPVQSNIGPAILQGVHPLAADQKYDPGEWVLLDASSQSAVSRF